MVFQCCFRVKGEDLEDVNPQAMDGVPDAMSISNLTEASLLHTLRERYSHDQVCRNSKFMSAVLKRPSLCITPYIAPYVIRVAYEWKLTLSLLCLI